MSEELNINKQELYPLNTNKNIQARVGNFPQKIGILREKAIQLLGLNRSEANILISSDKPKYIEKHFIDKTDLDLHISLIPGIIEKPDYVALHPNGTSVEYIKIMDEIVLIAVRLNRNNTLWFKTMFKITPAKLQVYIDSGTAKKYVTNEYIC